MKILIVVVILAAIIGVALYMYMTYVEVSGEKAPDFTVNDVNGNTIKLSDFIAEGKIVILNFITYHCPACKQEFNDLHQVYDKYHGQVVIITISIGKGETDEMLRELVQQYNITWYVARDTDDIASKYDIMVVPTTVIIDSSGHIRYVHAGKVSADTLIAEIEELLTA